MDGCKPSCVAHFSDIRDEGNSQYPNSEELLSIGYEFYKPRINQVGHQSTVYDEISIH